MIALLSALADARSPAGRQKDWDAHVDHMEQLARSPGFQALRERIIEAAALAPGERVLDVGCGTGLLALAAAPKVSQVSALDLSAAMCSRLREKLAAESVDNVEVHVGSADHLPFADGSFDVVVSNYCYHHLDDAGKRRALAETMRVLVPGGRFIFADMMFSIGVGSARDRAVLGGLALRMIRRGPAGLLRLLRNALKLLAGRSEHPAPAAWWQAALVQSGFQSVNVDLLQHEGGVAYATRP